MFTVNEYSCENYHWDVWKLFNAYLLYFSKVKIEVDKLNGEQESGQILREILILR